MCLLNLCKKKKEEKSKKNCVNYAFTIVAIKDYFEENNIFFKW